MSEPEVDQVSRAGGVRAWANGVMVDAAGAGPLGSDRDPSPLTYTVTTARQSLDFDTGKLVVVPWTRNERSPTAGLKTTSYTENVLAPPFAKDRRGVEALFSNSVGNLCECTGSNVFVLVDGDIFTPDLDSGPLAGVTRDLVIEWCCEEGLTARAEPLPMSILDRVQEVFITSWTKDVMGVQAIDDRPIAVPGPMTVHAIEVVARRSIGRLDP